MTADGRRGGIAGNPVLIGAATVLVVLVAVFLSYNANQGLPFVPTYSLKAADAERRQPRARQRGADRRHAGRVGRQDRGRAPGRRHEHRGARPQARAVGLAAAEGLDGADPAALGARPEVRGADPRQLGRGLRGRRHDPARPGHAGAGRVRRVREHVRRGHARRVARRTCRDSATRSPGAARASTRRSARSGRCCATSSRSRRTSPAARRTCRASSASWPTRRRSSRPPRSRRRSCSSTSTSRSARCARSRARSSRSRSPRARRRSTPRSRASPSSGRSWPTPKACSASCGPGVRALRSAAPDLADALEIGTPVLRRSPGVQPAPGIAADRARDVLRGPAGSARDPPPDRHGALAQPDAAVPRARRRPPATTSRSGSATSDRCCPRATATAPGSGSSSSPRRRARTTRAARRPRPPNGPTLENHLHTNPYPNTAAPGQPKECEAGNEPYIKGRTVTSNVAGHAAGGDGGQALMARTRRRDARSPFAVGLIALVVIAILVFLGFTKDIPFTRGYEVKAVFQSAERPAARLAGADRGRRGRQGQDGRGAGGDQQRRRHDGDRRQRPAAAQGRDAEDPAADLPGGQLLRRPHAGHAGRATSSTTATRSR